MAWFRRRKKEPPTPPKSPPDPVPTQPGQWRIGPWDQPDLTHADEHALARYQNWDRYVPYLELVQCDTQVKPALFFKIGYADYADWSEAVEPVTMGWNWYRTKSETPYVVIDFYVLFRNENGGPIGIGGSGQITTTTEADHRYSHQLRSRTLLDPADPGNRAAIEKWVAGPSPTMLFFIEEHFRATSYVSMGLGPSDKQDLLRVLNEATQELATEGIVPHSFPDACALLKDSLPPVSWWMD
jgi:hypothetical protein